MSDLDTPMTPSPGFADRVVGAWTDERGRRARRRRMAALAIAALVPLAIGVWHLAQSPVVELTVRVDRPVLPPSGGEATIMVTLDAAEDGSAAVDLAVVVDGRLSLTRDRQRNVQDGLATVRAAMGPHDRLIVDDAAQPTDDAAQPTDDAAQPTDDFAWRFHPEPCVTCGFDRAVERLATGDPEARRTLVLITDTGLDRAFRDKAAEAWLRYGVRTATIGVGGRFSPETVGAVASSGHGHFYFAHNSVLIGEMLALELDLARRAGLSTARLRVGGAVIDLGRLGGERMVLVPVEVSAADAARGLSVVLEARSAAGEAVSVTRSVAWRTSDDATELARRDERVITEQIRREAGEALVAALSAHEDGDQDAAQAALARGRAALDRAPADLRGELAMLAAALASLPEVPIEVATRHRAEAGVLFERVMGYDAASANQSNDLGGVFTSAELE